MKALSKQPLPLIGRISDGLYLFHIPVYHLVHGNPIRWSGPYAVAMSFALTFALAASPFWVVERRALRLKSRFGSMSKMPCVASEL